jgi:XTP/dITP diphosphohydrolase
MPILILATRNPGKFKEISSIFSDLPIRIVSLLDYPTIADVLEDGKTLEENALKKARIIYHETKIPALADDTGLEVYSLDMAPGIISARYAGENAAYDDNNRKLLLQMKSIPMADRGARFRTVAALVVKEYEKTTEGICTGKIAERLSGRGGFGYDPLFIPDGYNVTYAEMSLEEKNKTSHRGKAFMEMKRILTELLIAKII